MEFEISKVADAVMTQMSLFNCTLEEAWEHYTHDCIKAHVSLDEVKSYIENTIKKGELYERQFFSNS